MVAYMQLTQQEDGSASQYLIRTKVLPLHPIHRGCRGLWIEEVPLVSVMLLPI